MRALNWRAFSSKNSILNLSRFSCGMGLRSLTEGGVGLGVGLASRVLGGRWRVMGEWSEFRLCS